MNRLSIGLLFLMVCALQPFISAIPAYAEDTKFVLHDAESNKENLTQIVRSVLENQEKILNDVTAEQKKYAETLTVKLLN